MPAWQNSSAPLGPEPFDSSLTADVLRERLASRTTALKALLLNQHFIAGLGNIYVDEVLFACKLHPRRPADALDDEDELSLGLLDDNAPHTARGDCKRGVPPSTPSIATLKASRAATGSTWRSTAGRVSRALIAVRISSASSLRSAAPMSVRDARYRCIETLSCGSLAEVAHNRRATT